MNPGGNSYRRILKVTSLFGGVQIAQALLALIRGKCTAALLGPSGMGIYSLFLSSSTTLQKAASIGLNLAVVKEVASCKENQERLDTMMSVATRLMTATALAATLICILFSRWLSLSTFGDYSMTTGFLLLSVSVGFSVAAAGKLSILQGAGEIKEISIATLTAGMAGVMCAVPLYYFFHEDGIIPSLTIFSLASFVTLSRGVRRKLPPISADHFRWKENTANIKRLLSMGAILVAGDLFSSLATYLINIYIRDLSGDSTVGLYQAANSVTFQYAGVVLSVLVMDYFPRLSSVADDNSGMRDVVNRQTEIVAVVMSPLVILLALTSPLVIKILLSDDYLSITPLMRWMALGIFFKILMTPTGYISFAKGNRKLFFWLEGVVCNILTLLLSCIFFKSWGLLGLGYAMIADNSICLVVYLIINRIYYNYTLDYRALKCIVISATLSIIGILVTLADSGVATICGVPLFFVSAIWAFCYLRHRLHEEKEKGFPLS